MTLLERMDQFVHVTRLDRLAFLEPRPRLLRWLPLLAFAAMIGGYALVVQAEGHISRGLLTGFLIFFGGILAANFLRMFGPRLTPSTRHALDERERMVKAQAGAVSGAIFATLAIAGCFYMAVADPLGWWRPRVPLDWIYLGWGLQGGFMLLPTLVASWLQSPPADEAED